MADVRPHDGPKHLTLLINAIKNYRAPTAADTVKHTSRFDRYLPLELEDGPGEQRNMTSFSAARRPTCEPYVTRFMTSPIMSKPHLERTRVRYKSE